ncbi:MULTISPECIES: hypothetical protein [unclassified Arthrobacter]|uniref:hypothetical protein n=1 Tax=unclassified Arthrobacter TaxID=235627 RepID=UPI0014932168|nr:MULTISPECIES: hypothetical protein [unclassified Arthrobacter]NOJ64133.1 hypothetical protein [Arthrobacter sp. 147(2020)]
MDKVSRRILWGPPEFRPVPDAAPTTQEMAVSARLRSSVLAVGLILVVVSVAGYASLILLTAAGGSSAGFLAASWDLSGIGFDPQLPRTFYFAAAAVVGFLIGSWLLLIHSISSRQPDAVVQYQSFPRLLHSVNRPVLPIGLPLHCAWVALLLGLYVLLLPVQQEYGVLSPRNLVLNEQHLYLLLIVPAIAAVGAATATFVSVIKKLSYPGQMRRHPNFVQTKPKPYFYRNDRRGQGLDLAVAFIGGVLLFLGLFAGSRDYVGAALLMIPGVITIVIAIVMAFQTWRRGEPLYLEPATEPKTDKA